MNAKYGPYGLALVRSQIIHDDDVAGLEGRGEDLLDVGQEAVAVDRAVDEPWRGDAVMAQSGDEGHGLPATVGHHGREALAARRPPEQWRHIGLGPGLVDEHQAGGIYATLIGLPLGAPPGDVGSIALAGDQRLFL